MAIPITDKFKPKGVGGYALMDAADVEMPDGTRLSDFKGGVTSVNGQTGDVTISAINGKDGQDGQDGADGKDGVSPSVTITAITGGHRITITDATGTKSFDVMDGEDGKDGQDGDSASITVDSELSETSENPVQNKVIAEMANNFNQFFANSVTPNLLPTVTEADNGKALRVVGGVWTPLAVSIPTEDDINALIDAKLANFLNVAEVGM